MSMRIFLQTLGCRLNYAEMATLGRQLADAGHELTGSATAADLCVLNSCTVTSEAARKSRQLVRQMARANPGARLVVTGCYATLEGGAVSTLPNVSLVVGNDRKDQLLDLVRMFDEGQAARDEGQTSVGHPLSSIQNQPDRTRAFVKVQDGCHNHCTFCIVTVARGDEISRSVAEVVAEVNALHAQGYREVVLTGVHLGAYGRDRGTALAALVRALLADTSIPRIRLSSLEPFDLDPKFFDLWTANEDRLMPHLHLPAQSGSNRVLKRMARRNRAADFEALVVAARARIPGVAITTDLIAGFPGETQADFEETMAFARRVGFVHMHVFRYSARAGTAAALYHDQVPMAERRRRSRELNDLDRELGRAVRASFVGQTRPVLWEHRVLETRFLEEAGSLEEGSALWSGLTDNYLRVLTAVPDYRELHNQITPVRLTGTVGDDLWGAFAVGHIVGHIDEERNI